MKKLLVLYLALLSGNALATSKQACMTAAYAADTAAYVRDQGMPMATAYEYVRAEIPTSDASDDSIRNVVKVVYLDYLISAMPRNQVRDAFAGQCNTMK